MKKIILFIKIFIVGLLALGAGFFSWRFLYNKVLEFNSKNDLFELIDKVKNYNNGKYYLRNDEIYLKSGELLYSGVGISGNAEIYVTEFGVNLKLSQNNVCVYKTVGNSDILYYEDKCKKLNLSEPIVTNSQNNAQVTLDGDFEFYSISSSKIIPKQWKKRNLKDTIINLPYAGSFYVWTKVKSGVISTPIKVDVSCSFDETSDISDNVIYCLGSKINTSGYSWHVISDIGGELTLIMDSGQLDLMSQCDSEINDETCYYKDDILFSPYRWSKSKINKYFENFLYDNLKKLDLKEYSICDDSSGISGCKDGDGCAGYLKDEIKKDSYSCKKYTKSKIRLLTYDEYNHILSNTKDRTWVYNYKIGDFWLMNGYYKDGYLGFKVNKQGLCYLDENVTSLLEVRPVITIYK